MTFLSGFVGMFMYIFLHICYIGERGRTLYPMLLELPSLNFVIFILVM